MFIRNAIDQCAVLRAMPAAIRDALAAGATVRRYRSREYVWRVGDPDDSLQVVADGMVLIGIMGSDAEEVVLHVVARGECMGEPGIYAAERDRRTDARAFGRTTIVEVPADTVRRVLEASPEAMRVFVRRVSDIARALGGRVALTAFQDARARLVQLLLDLADSHGVATPRGRRIALPLSQRALAGLVSVRRERVNRLFAALEQEGALALEDGIITILSEPRLRSVLAVEAGREHGRDDHACHPLVPPAPRAAAHRRGAVS
jgi:CRP-like cAMP-binding protein